MYIQREILGNYGESQLQEQYLSGENKHKNRPKNHLKL